MLEDKFWEIVSERSIFPELKINRKGYQVLIMPQQVQKPGGEIEKQLESDVVHQTERQSLG